MERSDVDNVFSGASLAQVWRTFCARYGFKCWSYPTEASEVLEQGKHSRIERKRREKSGIERKSLQKSRIEKKTA